MTADEIKDQIIQKQDEYRKLMKEELDELAVLAYVHGWRSSRVEQGEKMREELAELRQQLEKAQETKLSLPLDVPKTREINSTCYNRYKEAYNPDGFSTDAFKEGAKWAIEEIKRRNEK